jgi:DNA recombination protein RmuC
LGERLALAAAPFPIHSSAATVTHIAAAFLAGLAAGLLLFWLAARSHRADAAAVASELLRQTDVAKTREVELLVGNLRDSVKAVSAEALTDSVRQLTAQAGQALERHTSEGQQALEGKKELIDQSLRTMSEELQRLNRMVTELEAARERKMGELSAQLTTAAEHASMLRSATESIRAALANPTARGQWGERMADDVLQLVGMKPGINYVKQLTAQGGGSRPDFTFLLPGERRVNMDVKFPFSSYLAYLDAQSDPEREQHKAQFVRDVRARVKEITSRDYIDPGEGTVDYVILFIPNERVYNFANECDLTLIDDALRSRVVVCSPYTLYAVLAVMRQAIDNFQLEQTAEEMLRVMGGFNKQWELFMKSFDTLGARIDGVNEAFRTLTTTRRNQLEKRLQEVEDLRDKRGLALEIVTEPIFPATEALELAEPPLTS